MITIKKKIIVLVMKGDYQHKPCFYHGEAAFLFFNYITLSDALGILISAATWKC
jgi:hypothetical protein